MHTTHCWLDITMKDSMSKYKQPCKRYLFSARESCSDCAFVGAPTRTFDYDDRPWHALNHMLQPIDHSKFYSTPSCSFQSNPLTSPDGG